jgi:hypothetical protein
MHGMGRVGGPLGWGRRRPGRVAGSGHHAERSGGGDEHAPGGRGESAAPAEPSAPRDDLVDIQSARGLLHPECPPQRVEVGHASVTAHHGRGGLLGVGRHPQFG